VSTSHHIAPALTDPHTSKTPYALVLLVQYLQQDENLCPIEEQPIEQHDQQQSIGQARQALLPERRQQQQQRMIPAAAGSRGRPGSAACVSPSSKQQQKQQQREKPAWQSEPFQPAPASLLRRKRSGVAEAWDVAAAAAAARAQRQAGEEQWP
jgi:hypothetical protein